MFTRWLAVAILVLAMQPASALDLDAVESRTHRDFDRRLARYAASDRLVIDPAFDRALDAVFVRLLAAAFDLYPDAMHLRWELQLVQDDAIGAECYSDGRILLNRAFVARYVRDPDQLAFVLGHEMAHALAQHVRSYYATAATRVAVVGLTPELLIENVESNTALRLALSRLMRSQEQEADLLGVTVAIHAGYLARGAEAVLRDFTTMGDGDRAAWTHDRPGARLEMLRRTGLLAGPLSQHGR